MVLDPKPFHELSSAKIDAVQDVKVEVQHIDLQPIIEIKRQELAVEKPASSPDQACKIYLDKLVLAYSATYQALGNPEVIDR